MELTVGTVTEGKVTKITPYGAFIGFEGGASGLLHISKIADGFVRDIHDYLAEGDIVLVKIIALDEKGKFSLERYRTAEQRKTAAPPDFVPKRAESSGFEDMMSRFMSASNEKLSSLKERGDVQPKRRRTR